MRRDDIRPGQAIVYSAWSGLGEATPALVVKVAARKVLIEYDTPRGPYRMWAWPRNLFPAGTKGETERPA